MSAPFDGLGLRRLTFAVPLGAALLLAVANSIFAVAPTTDIYQSPTALAATKDGKTLFVACSTAKQLLHVDLGTLRITSALKMPASPSGLAFSPEDGKLFVTCAGPESMVCIVDPSKNTIVSQIRAGHTAMSPVLTSDGKTLFVCNRFNNDVSVISLQRKKELCRIPVQREPVAASITPDDRFLLVANLLPKGPADAEKVAAVVSVLDITAGRVTKELQLPDGSTSLNDIRVSPDGKYAVVTHILSRFHLPADQVERGWMNANALTIIDLGSMTILNTVLLDDLDHGAANPWGLAWSSGDAKLVITHAGTHEISVIDFTALLGKLAKLPVVLDTPKPVDYGRAARVRADVPNDLTFLVDVRKRIKLPESDRGPRAVVMAGTTAYVANYFSDTLSVVDLSVANPKVESIPLGPKSEMSIVRRGELYFHDGTVCLQGWQSCSTCHPGEARMDGLNWDLPNDGIGNPKNTKSLLLAHKTPPAMSLGVRDTAATAVRAGIRHILFAEQPEEVASAIDDYLKSLKPVPSPYLVQNPKFKVPSPKGGVEQSLFTSAVTSAGWELSPMAKRGEKVFVGAGCTLCHPPNDLFTDLHQYDVGTRGRFDGANDKFYTPTLIEIWRTAPYLHDGSAATVRDVVTTRNPHDQHGKTLNLTNREIEDLCAYLLSL